MVNSSWVWEHARKQYELTKSGKRTKIVGAFCNYCQEPNNHFSCSGGSTSSFASHLENAHKKFKMSQDNIEESGNESGIESGSDNAQTTSTSTVQSKKKFFNAVDFIIHEFWIGRSCFKNAL
jgi:hypothetical protein